MRLNVSKSVKAYPQRHPESPGVPGKRECCYRSHFCSFISGLSALQAVALAKACSGSRSTGRNGKNGSLDGWNKSSKPTPSGSLARGPGGFTSFRKRGRIRMSGLVADATTRYLGAQASAEKLRPAKQTSALWSPKACRRRQATACKAALRYLRR